LGITTTTTITTTINNTQSTPQSPTINTNNHTQHDQQTTTPTTPIPTTNITTIHNTNNTTIILNPTPYTLPSLPLPLRPHSLAPYHLAPSPGQRTHPDPDPRNTDTRPARQLHEVTHLRLAEPVRGHQGIGWSELDDVSWIVGGGIPNSQLPTS
jgi:hypothetical protein